MLTQIVVTACRNQTTMSLNVIHNFNNAHGDAKLIEAEWRIYASLNWVIIGSDNGLSPVRCQAIIWIIVGILLIGPLGTNFSEILNGIQTVLLKNFIWKRRLQNGVYFVSASMR